MKLLTRELQVSFLFGALNQIGTLSSNVPVLPEQTPLSAPLSVMHHCGTHPLLPFIMNGLCLLRIILSDQDRLDSFHTKSGIVDGHMDIVR